MAPNLPLVLTAVVALFSTFILVLAYGAWLTRMPTPAARKTSPAE